MGKNQKNSDAKGSKAGMDPSATGASVDKIRDIIFGNQMRDYDKRFSRLEERLMLEIGSLRDETAKRLEAMESFAKKEIASLSERIAGEKKNRSDAVKQSSQEINAAIKGVSREMSQLVTQQAKDVTQLREQILDQSKALMDEVHQKHKDASVNTDRGLEELRNDKLDRSILAELLMEMAVRMSDELSEKLSEE